MIVWVYPGCVNVDKNNLHLNVLWQLDIYFCSVFHFYIGSLKWQTSTVLLTSLETIRISIGLRISLFLLSTTVIFLSTVNARCIVIGFVTFAPGLKNKRSWNSESLD